jgi:hypothetical protein
MIELTSKLNYDKVIELAMYLSFEAKLNDKYVWRAIEDAILQHLHLYELKHICQIQWAVTQMKPKFTSARLDNMLYNLANEKIESGTMSVDDFHHITQGFRMKKTKDMYMKLRQILVDDKDRLVSSPQKGNEKQWA